MGILKRPFCRMRRNTFLLTAAVSMLLARNGISQVAPAQPGQLATPGAPGSSEQSGLFHLPYTVSAPPLTVGDKFNYRVIQTFGLRGFVGAAIGSTFAQASGTPYAWGGGVEGYAKRYASTFGGNLSRQAMAFTLESTLHEDPRFFPSEEKPFKSRLINSFKQVFICKTDADHSSFSYGRVVSAFAAGQLINAWEPGSNGTVGDGLIRGVFTLGGDLAYNFAQEFIPFTRPKSIRLRP